MNYVKLLYTITFPFLDAIKQQISCYSIFFAFLSFALLFNFAWCLKFHLHIHNRKALISFMYIANLNMNALLDDDESIPPGEYRDGLKWLLKHQLIGITKIS